MPTGRIIVLPMGVTPGTLGSYVIGWKKVDFISLSGTLMTLANMAAAFAAANAEDVLVSMFDLTYDQLIAGPMLGSIKQQATSMLANYGWITGGNWYHMGFFEVKITKDGEPEPEYRWVGVYGIVDWDEFFDDPVLGYFGDDSYARAYMAAYLGMGYYSLWLRGGADPGELLKGIGYRGWYTWNGQPMEIEDTTYFDPIDTNWGHTCEGDTCEDKEGAL
jgi:hypothetical protein